MYICRSQAIKNPQYNPLDPDILFTTSLEALGSKVEKDSLKNIAQDYVQRKSINFTNVRKIKVQKKGEAPKKQQVYDVENFTISYSKNETFIRNINTVVTIAFSSFAKTMEVGYFAFTLCNRNTSSPLAALSFSKLFTAKKTSFR